MRRRWQRRESYLLASQHAPTLLLLAPVAFLFMVLVFVAPSRLCGAFSYFPYYRDVCVLISHHSCPKESGNVNASVSKTLIGKKVLISKSDSDHFAHTETAGHGSGWRKQIPRQVNGNRIDSDVKMESATSIEGYACLSPMTVAQALAYHLYRVETLRLTYSLI